MVWDKETSKAIISDDTISVTLTPNSDIMVKETFNPITNERNTENIKLDTAPVVIKGRICMPVRAVVEAFGCAVIWEEDTKTILIIAGVC